MGVLDISTRRERLGNLGDIRSVDTNLGLVQAANMIADSSRRLHETKINAAGAKHLIGLGVGKGLERFGGSINDVAEEGIDFIKRQKEEEDRKNADEYANKFTAKMLEHNQGDGKDVLGAMNETIKESDRGEWMDRNEKAAKKAHEEVLKEMGLTDGDFKDSRMQKWRDSYLVTQNAQWLGKRNAAMKAYADKHAEAKLRNDLEAVTAPLVREGAWADAAESMERVIERRGWDKDGELAKMFRRNKGETICGIGIKKEIDATMEKAVAAGADGGAEFDKLVKSWEEGLGDDSFLPPASWIVEKDARGKETRRNPLKEWLEGADMKSLKRAAIKDAKDAKAKWTAARNSALAAEKRDTVDAANRSIIGIYTGKGKDGTPLLPPLDESDPHSVEAHYATLSRALESVGTDPKLVAADPAMAAGLVKSANAMAQKGRRDAQKIVDQRTEQAFLDDYDDPAQLGWMTAEGFHKMTPGEAIQRATDAHGRGRIGDATYTKCLRSCSKAVDSKNQEFLDDACEAIGYSCPGIFSSRNGDILISRSQLSAKDKLNPAAAKTGVTRVIEEDGGFLWFDRTEDVTLGQLRKTLSLFTRQILIDEKNGTWNEQKREEYLKKFKELVKPTVEDWQKRKLQERLDEIDARMGDGTDWTGGIRLQR